MRFLMRALTGLALAALTIGLVGLGARPFLACQPAFEFLGECAFASDEQGRGGRGGGPGGGGRERGFAARVAVVELESIAPTVLAFGEVAPGRALTLRAPLAGELSMVSPLARDGAIAPAGAVLFEMDPADATAAWADARAGEAEAEAEVVEAAAAGRLAAQELIAAQAQRTLRSQALDRQIELEDRGVGSASAVETAQLALADADRAVLSAEQAVAAAEARIIVADLALQRARIVLDDAERTLDEIVITAPFEALLSEIDATVGRRVGDNEALARLVDMSALEVGFQVSGADFARLLDDDGALAPLRAEVTLTLGERRVVVDAQLARAAPTAAAGDGGRVVYAALDTDATTPLRPGDFVSVTVYEPELSDVARLPARALDGARRVLILGDDGRLEEVAVDLVRRQGSDVLVRGAPVGARIILERAPQLGPGVLVRPLDPDASGEAALGAGAGDASRASLGGGEGRGGRGDGAGRGGRGDGAGRGGRGDGAGRGGRGGGEGPGRGGGGERGGDGVESN